MHRLNTMRRQVATLQKKIRLPTDLDAALTRREWDRLSDAIFEALKPYMDARVAVASAIMQLVENGEIPK